MKIMVLLNMCLNITDAIADMGIVSLFKQNISLWC